MSLLDIEDNINNILFDLAALIANDYIKKLNKNGRPPTWAENYFGDEKNVIDDIYRIIKVEGNYISIENPARINKLYNNIATYDLRDYIVHYLLFSDKIIPDGLKLKSIDQVCIWPSVKYDTIRHHDKQIVLKGDRDFKVETFTPNIIIEEVEEMFIQSAKDISKIGSNDETFFIKEIQKLNITFYSDYYSGSLNNIFDKYYKLFGPSKIHKINLDLNDMYFTKGKVVYVYNDGLDAHTYNFLSSIKNLRADSISIKLSGHFLKDHRKFGEEPPTLNIYDNKTAFKEHVGYLFKDVLSRNNEFKRLDIIE